MRRVRGRERREAHLVLLGQRHLEGNETGAKCSERANDAQDVILLESVREVQR